MTPTAAEYADVVSAFGLTDVRPASLHAYAPVFRGRLGDRPVVLKRARAGAADRIAGWTRHLTAHGFPVVTPVPLPGPDPGEVGGQEWVVYPWVEGRPCLPADAETAGDLLGRLHAVPPGDPGPPAFGWPDYDDPAGDDPGEDLPELDRIVTEHLLPRHQNAVVRRIHDLAERVGPVLLPALRDADLPAVDTAMDWKAANLVVTPAGPVLVDPDNAERAPRLLDLALAALLFHSEHPASPARAFSPHEWEAFVTGYRRHVTLTDRERGLWPAALDYQAWEEVTWAFEDCDEWHVPARRDFLTDAILVTADRLPAP